MGAAARAAAQSGGRVLGVMPAFLCRAEVVYDAVETLIVDTMHERKRIMFEQSDAFAVLPGGIGTLEEVVELMSWRRLGLHAKPIVFLNQDGFWEPFFALLRHTVAAKLTPAWALDAVGRAERVRGRPANDPDLPASRRSGRSDVWRSPDLTRRSGQACEALTDAQQRGLGHGCGRARLPVFRVGSKGGAPAGGGVRQHASMIRTSAGGLGRGGPQQAADRRHRDSFRA